MKPDEQHSQPLSAATTKPATARTTLPSNSLASGLVLAPEEARGKAKFMAGCASAFRLFSFANYFDPDAYGILRVCASSMMTSSRAAWLPMHPHKDAEFYSPIF